METEAKARKVYIGVDPGKKGGFAVIREDLRLAYHWDDQDFSDVIRTVRDSGQEIYCCVENVHAMPGQGVASTFGFGRSFGFIQGVLTALKAPYELVEPRKWKREYSVTADKNTAIMACKRLFPDVSLRPSERCRKDSDGMAEALLLAEYARRHMGGAE